jgi:hypothetical protein
MRRTRAVPARCPRGDVQVKEFRYGPVAIRFSGKMLDAEQRPNIACSRTSIGRTD